MVGRGLRYAFGLLTLLVSFLAAASTMAQALDGQFVLTSPTGTIVRGAAPDYATLAWNDPWDMLGDLDVRQLDSPWGVYPNHFEPYVPCDTGHWCGKVRSDVRNPDLFLLHPGYQESLHVGRVGHVNPIDADYYTQLTFRMFIDQVSPDDPGFEVIWTNGTVADIGAEPSRYGESHLFKTYEGWHVYTVNLGIYQEDDGMPTYTRGRLPWSGQLTGLRLDPGLNSMNNRIVKLDWVRLTPPETYAVSWDTDQSCSLDVIVEEDVDGWANELLIYEGGQLPIGIQSTDSFYQIPASLPPGEWYMTLECNAQTAVVGPLVIEPTPTLEFLRPSFLSGKDFATTELGRSWDMGGPDSIYSYHGISSPQFSNGTLTATTLDLHSDNSTPQWEDPYVNFLDDNYWDSPFTTDSGIDTTQYRYLSFRMRVDGVPDVSYGWMSRIVWSDFLFSNCGTSNDIPLHGGWNEVTVDLWRTDILDEYDSCQSSWRAGSMRQQLRFDPLEIPVPTTFHVDYVRLTAPDEAQSGQVFDVKYALADGEDTSLTFYYDTDRDPANGRFLAVEYVSPPVEPSNQPYSVFVPLVANNYYHQMNVSGQSFGWDLANVHPGVYYLSADLDDGYHTTTWYSETPVIVE